MYVSTLHTFFAIFFVVRLKCNLPAVAQRDSVCARGSERASEQQKQREEKQPKAKHERKINTTHVQRTLDLEIVVCFVCRNQNHQRQRQQQQQRKFAVGGIGSAEW